MVRRRSRKAKIACSTHVCAWKFSVKINSSESAHTLSPINKSGKSYSRGFFVTLYGIWNGLLLQTRNKSLWKYGFTHHSQRFQPGVVACTCNVATYRLNLWTAWVRDHYGAVVYVDQVSVLSLVSTWSSWRNLRCTGFDSEVRTGPGWKHSRQKYPH